MSSRMPSGGESGLARNPFSSSKRAEATSGSRSQFRRMERPAIPTKKFPTCARDMPASRTACHSPQGGLAKDALTENHDGRMGKLVRILLLAMPDTASSLDAVMKFPNLGLCSLAAQVPEHDVRILDLVLRPRGVRQQVLDEVRAFRPDVIGYSAMSFQYATARALAAAVRATVPGITQVLGGYHATVLADAVGERDGDLFDFVVRGEGELAFRHLIDGLAGMPFDPSRVPG